MNSYMTRALRSRDPRYARILGKLGYGQSLVTATHEPVAAPAGPVVPRPAPPEDDRDDDLDVLRAEYVAATGEEPDGRWGAARLRREIDAAKVPGD